MVVPAGLSAEILDYLKQRRAEAINTGHGEKAITGRATGAAQTQRAVRLVRVAVLREEEAEE